jgi:hypothetical protein
MKIEKEVVIRPMTADGQELTVGDRCVFNVAGKCLTGIYKGITKHGAISFDGIISDAPVQFNVMPNSIDYIVKE